MHSFTARLESSVLLRSRACHISRQCLRLRIKVGLHVQEVLVARGSAAVALRGALRRPGLDAERLAGPARAGTQPAGAAEGRALADKGLVTVRLGLLVWQVKVHTVSEACWCTGTAHGVERGRACVMGGPLGACRLLLTTNTSELVSCRWETARPLLAATSRSGHQGGRTV